MKETLQYRHGTVDDKEALKDLAVIAFGQYKDILGDDHWTVMRSRLSDDNQMNELISISRLFVCTDGDKVIGMAFFIPRGNPTEMYLPEWCYLRLVCVHPHYSGRGIATKLTHMCIDYARQTNEKTVALHTSEFQDAARHVYESIGFTVLKELPLRYNKRFWIYTLDIS